MPAEKKEQVYNINLPKGGTSDTYLLRRLKRDHPKLAEKVVAGEMSAHAAAPSKPAFASSKDSQPPRCIVDAILLQGKRPRSVSRGPVRCKRAGAPEP